MSVVYEHERKARTTSRLQQHTTRVGALPQSHPGLCSTPVGPSKDTHGTPVPKQGRPWVAQQQATTRDAQQHTDQSQDKRAFRKQVLTDTCKLTW